jgi:hypothetical protein
MVLRARVPDIWDPRGVTGQPAAPDVDYGVDSMDATVASAWIRGEILVGVDDEGTLTVETPPQYVGGRFMTNEEEP